MTSNVLWKLAAVRSARRSCSVFSAASNQARATFAASDKRAAL